jgi:Mg-chelatase subunit ChlD
VGEAAEELRALGVQTVLINLEVPNLDFGDPKRLADQLQAEIYPLGSVSEPALRAMVRRLQKAPG